MHINDLKRERKIHSVKRLSIVVNLLIVTAIISLVTLSGNLIQPVSGGTLRVGGLGPFNYTTIQEAIDNSNPGDTIYLYEGTYIENLIVNKSISLIGEDKEKTIIDGNGSDDVVHITADSVTITGITIKNSGSNWGDAGIELHVTQNCYITNNIISNNYYGIFLHYSSGNNEIFNNDISLNNADGIYLTHSNGNAIGKNNVFENVDGIQASNSSANIIDNNTFLSNEGNGIYLETSIDTMVFSNTALYNGNGILLDSSSDNMIDDNLLLNNGDGIQLSNSGPNDIIDNSVLNNRYGIYLDYSNNNNIQDNDAFHNEDGIRILHSGNNIITNNNVLDNDDDGVQISDSSGNKITGNTISSNKDDGINFESSSENIINNNEFSKNGDDGIELFSSEYNVIANNTVSLNNEYGIYIWEFSNNNHIYHNNVITNTYQAFDNTVDNNQWDNGYLSGGNYWSNYIGGDEKGGSNQNRHGSDGIGDKPYDILAGTGKDRYPLISPFVLPPLPETNEAPSTNITTPTSDAEISGITIITGSALDSDGMVERVEVKIDEDEWIRAIGTAPWSYDLDTTPLTDGEHEIWVRSYDGMDYSVEIRRDVRVDNSVPEESIFEEDLFRVVVILLIIIIVLFMALLLIARKASTKVRDKKGEETAETEDVRLNPDTEKKPKDEDIENEFEKEKNKNKYEDEKTEEENEINKTE